MKQALQSCPENLRWKLLMLIGRYANLIGYQCLAVKVVNLHLSLTPIVSTEKLPSGAPQITTFSSARI